MVRRATTPKSIEQKIKEGRGQGEGKNYKSWLYVGEVPSKGRSHRIKGRNTNRIHHLFSDGERNCYNVFEWSVAIKDIREQHPLLPVEVTIAIAEESGIKHPVDRKTNHPIVLTTDFLLTEREGLKSTYKARLFKYVSELNSNKANRIFEKAEIERVYWQLKGIDFGFIIDHEIPLFWPKIAGFSWSQCLNIAGLDIKSISAWLTAHVKQENTPLN
jgi:hypothetical protein